MKRHAAPHNDVQIARLQQRIMLDRIALSLSIRATQQALREQLASPAMLLAATGAGFVLGRITRRSRAGSAPRARGRFGAAALEAVRAALKFASSAPMIWLMRFARARAAQADDLTAAATSERPVL
jgi:hypothetical protein